MNTKLQNGTIWYDTKGKPIHAHGGHILQVDGFYYWYGEDRTAENYVSCYRSTDLINWEFQRHILTAKSEREPVRVRTSLDLSGEDGRKINLERPKVLYNELTRKYVLWMHYENGKDYNCAACAIATCDKPDGDFTYHGSFKPFGYMSRDCTLFKDKSGIAYFISASRDNADLHIYRLTEDYMNVECLVHKLWQGEYREAPAVMERNGRYYMFTSFCTGWLPNQCRYSTADGIEEKWSMLTNIGDDTTFGTQPAFILKIEGTEATSYIYISDRWNGEEYNDSRYVFLPVTFDENALPVLEYCNNLHINANTGVLAST